MFILENMVFLLKYHIDWHPRKGPRSSNRKCSTRKGVLRNFEKSTGKDMRQSLFFNKAACLRPATLLGLQLYQKRSPGAGVFLINCEISKNTFFSEHPWAAASGVPIILCSFMKTFIDVFICCFPVKQKQRTWYIGLKFDFFFNFYGWRYSLMSCIQRYVWASVKETICPLGDEL